MRRPCFAVAIVAGLTLAFTLPEPAHAQGRRSGRVAAAASPESTGALARLPATAAEIDALLAQLGARLVSVRSQITSHTATAAQVSPPGATADEMAERQRLLQQWLASLDAQTRSLRRLNEVRALSRVWIQEQETWTGFSVPPPYPISLVEQLRDAVAGQQSEAQALQMEITILAGEVERQSAVLMEARKQLRLAIDHSELASAQSPRALWLVQLAELRLTATTATLHAAETERQVTAENLTELRKYIEFLDRKLAAAQARMRFTQADLNAILAQLNDRRATFRKELEATIAADTPVRRELESAQDALRKAQEAAPAPDARLAELQAAVEAAQLRAETSEVKIEILRSVLRLADYGQAVWEDRFWAASDRSLTELRAKQNRYQPGLESLRQWKKFVETKLEATTGLTTSHALKALSTNIPPAERESARQAQAALDERAAVFQRALRLMDLAEKTTQRLSAELTAREARVSFTGKLRFGAEAAGSFFRRIWNTELYVAEEAIISDGQKISVARSITVGKVVIALGIFLTGLAVARVSYGFTRTSALRWFKAEERTAGLSAQAAALVLALIALFVAMAAVRIPWTVFAFIGGALAIGVGFGAQTLINNFISGLILLFERSIRVGDIVEVDEQSGKIAQIGIRNSVIQRGDGVEILVPNSRLLEKNVVNWTLSDTLVCYGVSVGVAYGSPTRQVADLIAQAAAEHPHVLKQPVPVVLFEEFGGSALLFTLKFWMRLNENVDGGTIRSDLRHRINALFAQTGIALAFPSRELHLDAARPLEVKVINAPASGAPDSPNDESREGISK